MSEEHGCFGSSVLIVGMVFLAIWLLSACTPVQFTCGTGEFGPRASLVAIDPGVELVENLSRLCSEEAE